MDIAIVGGTGEMGRGLAMRFGLAGHRVVIGSRSPERAAVAAELVRERIGESAEVLGAANEHAAGDAQVVAVTVPFEGQLNAYRSIRDRLRSDSVVVDTTSPLATAVGGRPWQVLQPWAGSAAEQAEALLPGPVRLVAGFHTVSADRLQDVDRTLEGDVLLCGSDDKAKAIVGELVQDIQKLRWVDAGPLSVARMAETLTALLISVNRVYGTRDAGVRMLGRDSWGNPETRS